VAGAEHGKVPDRRHSASRRVNNCLLRKGKYDRCTSRRAESVSRRESSTLKRIFTPILGLALLYGIYTHLTAKQPEKVAAAM
jgi:hypothetical protein